MPRINEFLKSLIDLQKYVRKKAEYLRAKRRVTQYNDEFYQEENMQNIIEGKIRAYEEIDKKIEYLSENAAKIEDERNANKDDKENAQNRRSE